MYCADWLRHHAWRLAAGTLLLACAPVHVETPPRFAELDGRVVYERNCGSCHGLDGSGRTPFSTLLRTPPADLRQVAARHGGEFPDEIVRDIIDGRVPAHGARDMPIWGNLLSDAQLRAIVSYLHRLQESAPSARR
jgi:mono/diheme cytochrome c family protein